MCVVGILQALATDPNGLELGGSHHLALQVLG